MTSPLLPSTLAFFAPQLAVFSALIGHDRSAGMSEAEIQSRVNLMCKAMEEQFRRGGVFDEEAIEQVLALRRALAWPAEAAGLTPGPQGVN